VLPSIFSIVVKLVSTVSYKLFYIWVYRIAAPILRIISEINKGDPTLLLVPHRPRVPVEVQIYELFGTWVLPMPAGTLYRDIFTWNAIAYISTFSQIKNLYISSGGGG